MKDKDATGKQVEVLQLELEVLQRKVNQVETSNSSLARELTDAESVFEREKSAMELQIATTEQTITDLEEELKSKRDMISTSEKALEETRAKLSIVQGQYDQEVANVKALTNEIKSMKIVLAEAEASQTETASQEQQAAAKQIQSLQSRANSLEAQLKEATGNASRNEQKLKDYQAKLDSMQGTLLQSSTNVQARENEFAAVKEQAKLSVAEQAKNNEHFQSELDRVQKEMSDSLAKANTDIAQRGRILEEKERMLASLQEKYTLLLDQMESANVLAKKKLDAQAEQIRKLEVAGNQELSNLSGQVSTLKRDLSLTQGDAQKRITALNNKIQAMEKEIKHEQSLKDEARQKLLVLEQALMQAKKSLEKLTQEKNMEVMQVNLRLEQSTAAAKKEAESSKRLRSDLKGMSESLNKADVEIKQRENALRTMESTLSELQKTNEQLKSDIEIVHVKSQKDVAAKSNEINSLKEKVTSLTAEVDKEIKLRQDVIAGKVGIESMLQKKLDDMTKNVQNMHAEAQKTIDRQAQELSRLEASASDEKNALAVELSLLKNDMSTVQSNAQKIIEARTVEIRNMEQIISQLRSTIEDEKRLTDESMKEKSALERALQAKIVQLSNDITSAQKNSEAVIYEKNRELDRLNSHISKLTEEVKAESLLTVQAAKERDNIDHQLKAKIAQLEKELSYSRATNESVMKERDTVLSTMRADFNKLTKLKDDAQKERDDVERTLSAKNFELRNKIASLQITAEKNIQDKAEEVASLKMQVIEKAKSSDVLLNDKLNMLATVEDSLRAKTQLVEQLSTDIKAIRADADAAVRAEKQVMDEKAKIEYKMRSQLEKLQQDLLTSQANAKTAILAKEGELKRMEALLSDLRKKSTEEKVLLETQMQAELEQLKNDRRTSRADAEAAISELQKELSTQQLAVEDQEGAKHMAEAKARANTDQLAKDEDVLAVSVTWQEEVQQSNSKEVREPPKGFGKPALKTAATANSYPQKNIRLRDRITFRKVEQLREARLTNKSDLNGGMIVEKADPSPLLAAEGLTADKAEAVRLERLRVADEVAKNLKTEKECDGTSAASLQTKTSGGANSLRQLVMPQGSRNNVPERAPASQNIATGRAGRNLLSPSSQGIASPVGAPSFPKRKAVSPPSSQASTRRQGAPAPKTSSPANMSLGSPASDSLLTGLLKAKDASTASPFSSPASQAVTEPAQLANPAEKTEQVDGKSNSTSMSKLDSKRRSLKELLTSIGIPIGSSGGRTTITKLGAMATPEQPQLSSNKVLPVTKKSSLKNLLSSVGKPISSNGAKPTTSLGGLASPDLAAPSIIERRKKAVREDVVASAAVKNEASTGETKATLPPTPPKSNLSLIIQSQVRRQRLLRDQTQLGGTSTSTATLKPIVDPEPEAISTNTNKIDAIVDYSTNAAVASMKIQEAFQRALLSARIANDAKAKIARSFPIYRKANLGQMVQDRSKPTLSQQKAFANSNRRTSLFPEKVVSHLSRLLQK